MAQSHDFLTPRLDGAPWFEKPPLLYWMTAMGRALGLPDEWSARLPVALLSVAFLLFFFGVLREEFSARTAIAATTILATTAGWLGYSFVAVTDLPMSATFWAALLIAMYDTRREQGYVAGALLGLSVLAKGLVPLVLFVPVLLIARGKRLTMIAGAVAVGAPWYLLVAMKNGRVAIDELILKHHFARFFSPSLQHVQPFWYYVPILLAGIFPWTPLAGLLLRRKTYDDVRVRFLIAWLIYALVFFSVSLNKLPGYALPLLPALAIVFAVGLDRAGSTLKWWMGASAALLLALPVLIAITPDALLTGIRRTHVPLAIGWPFLLTVGLAFYLGWRERQNLAMFTIGLSVICALTYAKGRLFPELDERVSARAFWRSHEKEAAEACWDGIRREWVYELNYYTHRTIPECSSEQSPKIVQENNRLTLR